MKHLCFLMIITAAVTALCTLFIPPASAKAPANDYLIVEGKRIGPVSIGLEEEAVIAILGKPSSRNGYEGGTSVLVFPKEGFLVAMTPMREKPSMKVTDISTTNSAYKTGKGIHVGSTAAEVTGAYGTPRVSSYKGKTSYAFLDSKNYLVITFELSGDKVSKIMVSHLEM